MLIPKGLFGAPLLFRGLLQDGVGIPESERSLSRWIVEGPGWRSGGGEGLSESVIFLQMIGKLSTKAVENSVD